MDKRLEQIEERLENLLLSKSFQHLNAAEKRYALSFIDRKEYQEFRQILLQSKQLFETKKMAVPAQPADRLYDALKRKKAPSFWQKIQQVPAYRIPVWQVGMAMMLIGILFFQGKNIYTEAEEDTPIYVQITDTIIKEIPVYIDTISEAAIDIATNIGQQNALSKIAKMKKKSKYLNPSSPATAYIADTVRRNDFPNPKSRSFTQDEELMNFMAEIK